MGRQRTQSETMMLAATLVAAAVGVATAATSPNDLLQRPAPPHGACDCLPTGCPATLPARCAPKDVLWLPLGDSITWGCNGPTIQDCHADSASYRVPLALALSQHPLGSPDRVGLNITTMGTLTTGPPYVPAAWLKHEGHPGWQINTIDGILNKSLATSATSPDLITIHLWAPLLSPPPPPALPRAPAACLRGSQLRRAPTGERTTATPR